jgi:hypothetical protein
MDAAASNTRKKAMAKEQFLTVRWNNILTLGLGVPAALYIDYAFSSGLWTTRSGLIGRLASDTPFPFDVQTRMCGSVRWPL